VAQVVALQVDVVGVQEVGIELHGGVALARVQPGVLHADPGDGGPGLARVLAHRHSPVIAVVADGADDLLPRHDLEGVLQVLGEPLLAGDGADVAAGIVFVVIHQDDAVGVRRHVGVIELVVVGRDIDVELQAARVQVCLQLRQQGLVAGLRRDREAFQVQGQALVLVAGQELQGLAAEVGARGGIVEKIPHPLDPVVADGIEVVDQGKDLGFRLLRLEERHHLVVDIGADLAGLEDVVEFVLGGHRLQAAVGGEHVQPLRVEHVDLVHVLAQRGEAGGVPGHVEGGADAFLGVEHHLRGRGLGLAVRDPAHLGLPLLALLQRVVLGLLLRQQEFGKLHGTDGGVEKENDDQGDADARDVQQAAQQLPALALGIVEDGFCHGRAYA
jgi:hypothetical protein